MPVKPIYTQLEHWEDGKPVLREYQGVGKLRGKAALITGADSGIGRAVALLFAREGAVVTITHVKGEEKDAKEVKEQIEREGSKCLALCCDLLDKSTHKMVIDEHLKVYGKLDILVNDAGRQVTCQKHEDIDMDEVQKTRRSCAVSLTHADVRSQHRGYARIDEICAPSHEERL